MNVDDHASTSSSSSSGASRPRMMGSMLPCDSFRMLRGEKKTKKLAAAGLDLFREGLDSSTNLGSISEADDAINIPPMPAPVPLGGSFSSIAKVYPSQVIVCYGPNFLDKAVQLYRDAIKRFQDASVDSICYIAPVCSDMAPHGVHELEALRNALVHAGVPPHHILMDCSASNGVENALKLLDVIRHFHFEQLVLVVHDAEYPYAELCFKSVLCAPQRESPLHVQCHLFRDDANGQMDSSGLQRLMHRARAQLPQALETARQRPSLSRPAHAQSSTSASEVPVWTIHQRKPKAASPSKKYFSNV